MPRRRRRGAAGLRQKSNQGWAISLQFNQVLTGSAGAVAFVLLQDEDWITQDSASQRATLKTVRGNLTCQADAGGVGAGAGLARPGILQMAIILQDEDAAVPSPVNPAFYAEEDVLWQHQFAIGHADGSLGAPQFVWDIPIHIKVGRRLRKGQELQLVASVVMLLPPPPTVNWLLGWNLRSLVKRN